MKSKIILSFLFVSFMIKVNCQSDSLFKMKRHEIGVDITSLFKQFLNFNPNSFYSPIYYVSYRYHLKKSNIRFGLGGGYAKNSSYPYMINGEEKIFYNESSNISFRLGYERVSELSRKWQAFYGLDFRPTFININNETNFSNGGYMNGNISSTTVYGIAPMLGFRYRISDRVSIITETSFSFDMEKSYNQNTFTSLDNNLYPPTPNTKKTARTNITTTFSQPIFLLLAVDI